MEIIIENISNKYLGEYTLTKELDNNFIVEKLEGDAIYLDSDHKYLVERAVFGDDKLTGTISKECGGSTFTKNVFIKHNEGTFDLRKCETTKKVTFENVLDCVANLEINIFDYPRNNTVTIQGDTIERETTTFFITFEFENQDYTLSQVLNQISIENREYEGFYIESGKINVESQTLETQFEDEYLNHTISGNVTYVRISNATQINSNWVLIPGGSTYYYSNINGATFNLIRTDKTVYVSEGIIWNKYYIAGFENGFKKTEISNTINLNTILLDLFSCTGLTLVSNFLGINNDATNPTNDKYEWANNYAQNVRIAQSYDIIKEDAEEDSFGISGKIKAKNLLSNIFKAFNLLAVPDGTDIRLEHVSYFTNKGIDLTSSDYEITPLSINKDSINTETFSFAKETPNADFFKTIIEYNTVNIYDKENDKPLNCDLLLTDVFGSLNNIDLLDSGFESYFFLICTDGNSIIGLNKPFSMTEIVTNLYDIHRPMKTGTINGNVVTFGGYSVGLEGELIVDSNLMNWDAIQPLMSIKTNEGTYLIDSLEIDENDKITFKIKK